MRRGRVPWTPAFHLSLGDETTMREPAELLPPQSLDFLDFLRRAVFAVVIGLLVGVGYYFQTYRHGEAPEEGLTVVTAESTTASNKRALLAENKEGDFQLYAQGDKAILVHQGKSKIFSGWSRYLTRNDPSSTIRI